MDSKKFATKLIFNRDNIPAFGEVSKEAIFNMEVAIRLSEGIKFVIKSILERFISSLEKQLKEKLPEYEVYKFKNFPYGEPMIFYKSNYKVSEDTLKKLIKAKSLNKYEKPILLTYAIEYSNKYGLFYGIRKGSDKLPIDKNKLLKSMKMENATSTEWWVLINSYDDNEYNFNMTGRGSLSNKTTLQIMEKGDKMLNYYVQEFVNFVRETENKLDEFIEDYKKMM